MHCKTCLNPIEEARLQAFQACEMGVPGECKSCANSKIPDIVIPSPLDPTDLIRVHTDVAPCLVKRALDMIYHVPDDVEREAYIPNFYARIKGRHQ